MRAIVLTGSLARGEATLAKAGPQWRLLGDADFYLVFHARLPLASEVESVERKAEKALRDQGVQGSVGLSPVGASYFCKMPPHILTYELRSCGHIVWGDADILSQVPPLTPEQISLEDAWRLLANRIIEQLETIAFAARPAEMFSTDTQYRTVKLYLDMATSYLVFAGRYFPTYRAREEELARIASDPSAQADPPFSLEPFADRVKACTRFKLKGCGLTDSPRQLFEDAVHYADLLWRWELERLTGETCGLMRHWMRRQPVTARIRGWASALRRCRWHRSWRQWPHWTRLSWRGSPRYWVYSVAAELFFQLPLLLRTGPGSAEPDIDWRPLAARLPLPDEADSDPRTPGWQRLARLVVLNYRRFLEGTTA